MKSSTLFSKKFKNRVILIGYNLQNICVYNEFLSLSRYYDKEHIWVDSFRIINLQLPMLHEYLFDKDSKLIQEFTSYFDTTTGNFIKG